MPGLGPGIHELQRKKAYPKSQDRSLFCDLRACMCGTRGCQAQGLAWRTGCGWSEVSAPGAFL